VIQSLRIPAIIRLDLQIEINGAMRVLWTESKAMKEAIVKVTEFPFETTIIEKNETYIFS